MKNFIKEDAMHIAFPVKDRENEFEWWYFDAALDNGDHLVVMYSTNDTRLKPRRPSVRTNIYEANGNEIWELKEYKETEVSLSYDKCDTHLGEEYCIDKGGYYEFYTNINGNGAKLKLYPENPHWSRPAGKNIMGWTVAVPQGRVEGVIIKNGIETKVKGTGYHDHNWGFKPMGNIFKNWYWGKVHTEDISIDYSVMVLKFGKILLGTALITDKDGVIFEPSILSSLFKLKSKLNKISKDPDMGFEYANEIVIKLKDKNFKMDLKIEVDHMVMKEKAKFTPSESAYRYIGKETMTITRDGVEKTYNTKSLHEIVFLEK